MNVSLEKIKSAIEEKTGLKVAYGHYDEPEKLPYIVYAVIGDDVKYADDKPIYSIKSVQIDCYTEEKDTSLEEKIGSALSDLGLAYEPDYTYVQDQDCYAAVFYTSILRMLVADN